MAENSSDNSVLQEYLRSTTGDAAQANANLSAFLLGENTKSTPGSPQTFQETLGFNSVRTSPTLRPAAGNLNEMARHSFTNLGALGQYAPLGVESSSNNSALPSATGSPTVGNTTQTINRRNILSGMASLNMSQQPPLPPPVVAHDAFDQGVDTGAMFETVTPSFAQPNRSDSTMPSVTVSSPLGASRSASIGAFGRGAGVVARQPITAGANSAEAQKRIDQTMARGLHIELDGIPSENAKSRVETQIKLTLRLNTNDGARATCWTHLALPELLVSRDKFRHRLQTRQQQSENGLPASPQHVVRLEAMIKCSSDLTREVETCSGCINREYKRSLRRKDARARSGMPSACTTPMQSRPESPLGDSLGVRGMTGSMEADWDESRMALERKRVVIFNCNDLLDFSKGEVVLPTRITCYCRHHMEKVGFCLYLTLVDANNNVVASHVSPPIMITDDHKSTKFKIDRSKTRAKAEYERHGDGSAAYANHALSGMSSPHAGSGVAGAFALGDAGVLGLKTAGGRQTMSARNSPTLRPHHGYGYHPQHGFLDTYSQFASLAGTPSLGNTPLGSPLLSAAHISGFESPFRLPQQQQQQALSGYHTPTAQQSAATMASLFGQDAAAATAQSQALMPISPMYGPSAHGSALFGGDPMGAATRLMPQLGQPQDPMQIGQLIPKQGPVAGGASVLITGRGFHQNIEVYFGEARAGRVRVESPTSITCVLPPTKVSGSVPLRIRDQVSMAMYESGDEQGSFVYNEDTDQAMAELALQIVGLAQSRDGDPNGGSPGQQKPINRALLQSPQIEAMLRELYSASTSRNLVELENSLIKLFSLLIGKGLMEPSRLATRHDTTGRTMLHFASLLGMCSLLSFTLRNGCVLDDADNNGMTAMHFACMFGRSDIVELLLNAGASHNIRACFGLTPADMARSLGHVQVSALIDERDGYMNFIKDDQVAEPSLAASVAGYGGLPPGWGGSGYAMPVDAAGNQLQDAPGSSSSLAVAAAAAAAAMSGPSVGAYSTMTAPTASAGMYLQHGSAEASPTAPDMLFSSHQPYEPTQQ
ncbi:SPT3 Dosage dependent suppressor of Ty-induced promoter mutations-like protein [Coemansia sp. RSA 988]|nr:SPT3 Dosage dependent suppressor of Ty-induced promoter mutations-like protein [Coemansia sp. RSA 988]